MRPLLISSLIVFVLAGCNRSDWERTSEEMAPDHQYAAIAEYKGAPASNSDHRRIRLIQSSARSPSTGQVVVSAANANRAVVHWENDDRLIVEVCGATSYEVQARHFRDPPFKEDGEENAIRVEVVSVKSDRNGRQLCADLPAK